MPKLLSRDDLPTLDVVPDSTGRRAARPPKPGAIVLFDGERALLRALGTDRKSIELGRDSLAAVGVMDGRVSRRHAECSWVDGTWRVRDGGSRNGTWVDGERVTTSVVAGPSAIVRVGDTLVWLVPDVVPHEVSPVRLEGRVAVGATFGAVLQQVALAAAGRVLHVQGPSGAGKELVARAFHEKSRVARGPFVAINCAAIPEGVAERVLFGAKKGSFSGAHADAVGHLQEADGGTLFLDEIAELDLAVQGKLLRALEAGEIIPLGASRPVAIDVRFCSATHGDLRRAVADKTFREDLYFRVARPAVEIPPLAGRREEIPILVEREVRALGAAPHASLVEACLVRPWPGNVRELLTEVAAAARGARALGEQLVHAADLAPGAGLAMPPPRSTPTAGSRPRVKAELPAREVIEEALRRHQGRVATAARDLAIHRNQLRRWLEANDVDPGAFGEG